MKSPLIKAKGKARGKVRNPKARTVVRVTVAKGPKERGKVGRVKGDPKESAKCDEYDLIWRWSDCNYLYLVRSRFEIKLQRFILHRSIAILLPWEGLLTKLYINIAATWLKETRVGRST